MGADWIPVSIDLASREEVLLLASTLRRSPAEIVGLLVITWSWFSRETLDGVTRLDVDALARGIGVPASFLQAAAAVGWLSVTEHGCAVPKFDRWLSPTAKRRTLERLRQANHRLAKKAHGIREPCHACVTQMSRSMRDGKTVQEQIEVQDPPPTTSSSSSDLARPPPRKTTTATTAEGCNGSVKDCALGICAALWPGRREPITDSRDQRLLYQLAVAAQNGHRPWIRRLVQAARQSRARAPMAWVLAKLATYAPEGTDVERLLAAIEVPAWALADPRHWPDATGG
jgi:hypothetical protein